MLKKLPLILICFTIFFVTACGQEDTQGDTSASNEVTSASETQMQQDIAEIDHEIDDNDIIIGAEDAAHEMIVYYSPGCIHCIRLYEETFDNIKTQYIDTGELKYIIRDIPLIIPMQKDEDGGQTKFDVAQKNSALMAINMRCTAHYNGDDAYFDSLTLAVEGIDLGQRVNKSSVWPYYTEEGINTAFSHIAQNGQLTREQYISCLDQELQQSFLEAFDKNGRVLTQTLNIKNLPAYFLDGEHIDFGNSVRPKNILIRKLQEKMK